MRILKNLKWLHKFEIAVSIPYQQFALVFWQAEWAKRSGWEGGVANSKGPLRDTLSVVLVDRFRVLKQTHQKRTPPMGFSEAPGTNKTHVCLPSHRLQSPQSGWCWWGQQKHHTISGIVQNDLQDRSRALHRVVVGHIYATMDPLGLLYTYMPILSKGKGESHQGVISHYSGLVGTSNLKILTPEPFSSDNKG